MESFDACENRKSAKDRIGQLASNFLLLARCRTMRLGVGMKCSPTLAVDGSDDSRLTKEAER